jgi:hypothetical protein
VVLELLAQPALFLDFNGTETPCPPPEPAQPRYTGERSTLDDERMLKVGALRLLGASDREIAAACHVTTRSIPLLLQNLEKTGRLTALQSRLALWCGDNAERASLALRALIDEIGKPAVGTGDTDLAAMIKSVTNAVDVATRNTLLLTGQATERIELTVGAARDEVEAWLRQVPKPIEVESATVDFVSSDKSDISKEICVNSSAGHTNDTSSPADLNTRPGPAATFEIPSEGVGGGIPEMDGSKTPMSQ